MKIEYDKIADALYFYLQQDKKVANSREIEDGLIVDLDDKGRVIGIELLDISKKYPARVISHLLTKDLVKS